MDVTSKIGDIDAQNFPVPLYKYRQWDDKYHRTILTDRIVYFAAPTTFDDKLEFRNFKRFDLLTEQQVYDKYLEKSFQRNPSYDLTQHSAYAMEWTQRAPFKDPVYLKETQLEQFLEYDKRVGVLSLCETNDNPRMWHEYAKHGEGFCVGFDTYVIAKSIPFVFSKVEYPPDGLPVIYGTDTYDVQAWKQTFNKTLDWEFEQEYRFFHFNPNMLSSAQRSVKLPPSAFVEVIIGWAATKQTIKSILTTLKQQNLKVDVLIARRNGDKILIDKT